MLSLSSPSLSLNLALDFNCQLPTFSPLLYVTFLSLDARARDTHTPTQGRKKKFIDKKESSTFHVVHRSQQDKANEGEEEASEFVLIPSGVSYLLQTACQTFVCVCVLFEKQLCCLRNSTTCPLGVV